MQNLMGIQYKSFAETNLAQYEVENGLTGLQRSVIIRLCRIFWQKPDETKTIFGMCKEYLDWKNHALFIEGRPVNIKAVFRRNPLGGFLIIQTPRGQQCTFSSERRTVFLNREISKGVYLWVTMIKHDYKHDSRLFLGAARSDTLSKFNGDILYGVTGAWTFSITPSLMSCVTNVKDGGDEEYGRYCAGIYIPDNAIVSIEVDTSARTLSFSVNETIVPHVIAEVPAPLHLGMSGFDGSSFTSLSFRRLPSPISSKTSCVLHPSRV